MSLKFFFSAQAENLSGFFGSSNPFNIFGRTYYWVWGTGGLLIDPFVTLILILFSALVVFASAKILIPNPTHPENLTYETFLRMTSYAMSASVLYAVPFVGPLIAPIAAFIITVIGVKELFVVSGGRATFIVLFPKLLFYIIITVGVVLVLISLLNHVW